MKEVIVKLTSDRIKIKGGLDSGEWHTALLAQIAQNLAVIADVMMADRKTENSSEKPNNSKVSEIPTGSTISKMEQVDWKDQMWTEAVEDEPQTTDYCDVCNHKGCDNCIADANNPYCVPSGYEPTTQTETQNSNLTFEKRTMRDCYNCKRYETEGECIECHYEPKDKPQTDCAWK